MKTKKKKNMMVRLSIFITLVVCMFLMAGSLAAQTAITVTSPNGGEEWQAGDTQEITWDSTDIEGNVTITYSIDNGFSWLTLAETANTGSYSWAVPDVESTQCLVRLTSTEEVECETRGVWVIASVINTPEKQAKILADIERANLNTVLVSIPRVNGNWGYGSQESFLAFITEAKNRGLSVHAWMANTRRLWGIGETYIEYRDPAEQEAQSQWVQDVLALFGTYLDGVHLDYIRYMDYDLVNQDGKMEGVRAAVRRIHTDMNANYPGKLLSAAVFNLKPNRFDRKDDGSVWTSQVPQWFQNYCADNPGGVYTSSNYYYMGPQHMQVQQDPVGWLQEGIIDYLMPMQYTTNDDVWARETTHWKSFNQYVGNDFTRVYPGLAWKPGKYDVPGNVRKIKYDRLQGMKGDVLFRFGNLDMDDAVLIDALTIDSEENEFEAPYKSKVPSCMGMQGAASISDTSDAVFSILSEPPVTGGDISGFALFATNSIYLRTGVVIEKGHTGVLKKSNVSKLGGDSEIVLSGNVQIKNDAALYGNRIKIKPRSSVDDVYCNTLKNYATVRGDVYSPISLPLGVSLPRFPSASPGTQNISAGYKKTVTLTPGRYGTVTVAKLGVLVLEGGTYQFNNLKLGDYAKLLAKGPVKVIIKKRLESGNKITIGPKGGTSVKAKNIVIYVKGINGSGGGLYESPKSVTIGPRHTLKANVYAPNGTIWVKARGASEGAYIAKDLMVDYYEKIKLNSAF